MNGPRSIEERISSWLEEEAQGQLPDRVLEATFTQTRAIRARPGPTTWRPLPMSRPFATLLAVGAAAIIIVLGFNALRPASTPAVGSSPSPSNPTPSSPAGSPGQASTPPYVFAPLGASGTGTIVFTRHNAAGGDDTWLIDPAGTNEQLLAAGACCAVWAPDGRQLAIGLPGARPDARPQSEGAQLFDFPSLSRGTTIPSACGACGFPPYYPDGWSPDGRFFVVDFEGEGPQQQGLAIAAFNGTDWLWGRAPLTGAHPDLPVAFAPDSGRLLFVREERTEGPVSVGSLMVMTVGADPSSTPPDIKAVLPAGFELRTNGLLAAPASWMPDGRSIVFAGTDTRSGSPKTGIFEVGASSPSSVRPLVDAAGATGAHLSPDGAWIAFDRQEQGGFHDLFVMHPDGSATTNLTASFAPGVCCAQWSPDGSALLAIATSTDDEHEQLIIVPIDGGPIHQVTQDPNGYTAFLWGPVSR